MTSAVILQLAQEGKLELDDPVSKYVPGVPGGDSITIAQLLEMRSGLYNFTNDPADRDQTWTTTRPGCGPRRSCWTSRSPTRRFPARRRLRVQQHQLRAARPDHREGGR